MTFLNPAILFGLLAAAIPILIHLFNLRKLKRIEFSSLRFLKELQKNKIRRVKLKQWLLLALRALIILLLVGAFARPALTGFSIAGNTSAAKNTAVFLIDDSFSMTAVDVNGSLFNQSKQKALECLSLLKEGDDAALLTVSSSGKENKPLTKDIISLQTELRAVNPSPARHTLHEAIIRAAKLLGTSNNFNKELYIFTDLQQGSLIKDSAYTDLSELLTKRVQIYLFPFQNKSIYNLGIDSLRINTAVFEKGKPVSVSVFVKNHCTQPARNEVVSLYLNKERTAQKGINLAGGALAEVVLESPLTGTGIIQITASLEEDDVLADNKRYAVVTVPQSIPIGLFVNNPNDSKFFELALGAIDSVNIFKISKKPLAALNADDLSKYRSIYIFGMENIVAGNRIKEYISNGGGAFLIPASDGTISGFNSVMQQLTLPVAQSLHPPVSQIDAAQTFSAVDYTHPLFAEIFQKGKSGQLASPEIYGGYQIQPRGNGRGIFSFADKTVFLADYKIGRGHILVSAASFSPRWTNFPLRAFFVPFVLRSVYYLSSLSNIQQEVFAGETTLIPSPETSFNSLKITSPDAGEEIISAGQFNKMRMTEYSQTGIYRYSVGSEIYAMTPVNHSPAESVTETMQPVLFKQYLDKIKFKGNYKVYDRTTDASQAITQARYGTELWKFLVIFAVLVALIEMWISKATK